MSDDVTVGEVARRLDSFEKHTTETLASIVEQIKALNFVQQGVYEADERTRDRRFQDIEKDIEEVKASVEAINERRQSRISSVMQGLVYPGLILLLTVLLAGKSYL